MMDLVDKHELITRHRIKMINRTEHQLKNDMVLTMLGPDHCDLHILEHKSEDRQTELEETCHSTVVKTEERDDSILVDGDMDLTHIDENNINDNDFVQDLLKYESITFQCTLCLEEFDKEPAYIQHSCISMHLQNGEGDGECDASQVCEPQSAVSNSSSHSSLITEDKQAGSAHAVHTVASLSSRLATVDEHKVQANEETDAIREVKLVIKPDNSELDSPKADKICESITSIYRLPDCVIKLYDIFKNPKQGAPIKDETFVKAPAISCSDSQNVRTASKDTIYCPAVSQSDPNTRRCNLVKHLKISVKSFTCKICNRKFAHSSGLMLHMRTHTGEKPYSCKICDYKCANKSNLGTHIKTHTGDKPYSCKICDYKCAYKSYLVTHMRTHTGEKTFVCKICNKTFACNYILVRHMKTHTGDKPYSCNLCDYKCTCKSNLGTHMKHDTDEKTYACMICDFKCR